MSDEELAWNQADKLTLFFGSLAIECFFFVVVFYLGYSIAKERKRQR
jgi:hypothetical protein